MIILVSESKNKIEEEIREILINSLKQPNIITLNKNSDLNSNIKNGIIIILDNAKDFADKSINGMVGICEDCNKNAIDIFSKNNMPVITCGMNVKNTVTFSSINDNSLIVSLQRVITDSKGKEIEPTEFKLILTKDYNIFSVMASVSVLLLNGIFPSAF